MSMDREAYRLANEIKTELYADGDFLAQCPGEEEMKHYKSEILKEMKSEKKARMFRRGVAAAACAALMLTVGGTFFGEEVHAALQQVKWSLSSALGLSGDLAKYSEVLHTSVTKDGYVLTLQEVIVSGNTLVTNYTFAREDGAPLGAVDAPSETVYINGKRTNSGGWGQEEFLDEEQTVKGVVCSQVLELAKGIDLTGENEFRLVFDGLDANDHRMGTWEFTFTADGAALQADTKRITLGKTFELPDGVSLTLGELTLNELEQRITFEVSGDTRWMPMVRAKDSDGKQVEFGMRSQSGWSGFMTNEEIIEDGRLSGGAKRVKITLYAQEVPKSSGKLAEEYVQIGEPFEVELRP